MDALHVVELNFTDFNVQSTAENCEDGFVMVSGSSCCHTILVFAVRTSAPYLSYSDIYILYLCNFSLIHTFSLIQVHDGEDLEAPLLLQHCGNSLPPQLLSTGRSLTVRLKADGQAPSKGFSAKYKRVTVCHNT